MKYKLKKLITIKKNIFNSSKILSFRRPKWQYLKKSFLFVYYKVFFYKSYKVESIISWLFPFRDVSKIFIKKRFYLKTTHKLILVWKSIFQIFYKISSLKKWQNHLKNKVKFNRSKWVSCFELKPLILIYRIGWCLSITSSLNYLKKSIFLKNNNELFCGYTSLIIGDLLNVNYKYFKLILFEIKNKSSFFFLPFYNTFLNSRKPFVYKRIVKDLKNKKHKKHKKQRRFRLKFLKILFLNRLVKMLYMIKKKKKIKKTKITLYYMILNKFFDICNINLILFKYVSKFTKLLLKKKQKTFILINFIKQYLFISIIKQQLFKLIYFYLFKFSYFIDKFSFLIPHYIFINYNNLELLILLESERIKHQHSKIIFWNQVEFL